MFEKTKLTLITNLRFVQLVDRQLRMDCYALLLEEGVDTLFVKDKLHNQLRGFGLNASWPAFSYWCPEGPFSYTLTDSESKNLIFMGKGKPQPLFSGATLTLGTGESFYLDKCDSKLPMEFDSFSGDGIYERCWAVLDLKAPSFQRTPYVPRLTFGPNPNRLKT